jgi:hypothetical protein
MTKPADFMVVLRDGVDANDLALLAPITHSYNLKSGLMAHVLWCKTVDTSGAYLSAEAKLAHKDGFAQIQIPHGMVLTIAGSMNAPPMGFVWDAESREQPHELKD